MGKKLDLTGKRFYMLEVIKKHSSTNKYVNWLCRCDCGREVVMMASSITSKTTRSCGCFRRRKGNTTIGWKGFGDLSLKYYHKLEETAKRRKLIFDVSIEYLWNLYLSQNKQCIYTKDLLSMPYNSSDFSKGLVSVASLDRIDNTKGYIEGNVQWINKDINMMKRHYEDEYFISLCKKVANNA